MGHSHFPHSHFPSQKGNHRGHSALSDSAQSEGANAPDDSRTMRSSGRRVMLPDASYADPIGDLPVRPKTGARKKSDEDEWGNVNVDQDLLPD